MTDNKNNNDWAKREVGALWLNQKSDGTKYLTGSINGEKVVVFKNQSHAENDKAPYFRIYKSLPKEGVAAESASSEQVEEPDLI